MIRLAFVSGLCVLAAAALPAAGLAAGNNKHDFSCRTCHSTHKPHGRFLWRSTPKAKTAQGTPLLATEALCYSCHAEKGKGAEFFEPGMSHPINVVPSKKIKVPSELGTVFVKDVGNVITCTSCHDPHGKQKWFLKKPVDDDQLCKSCHQLR